MTYTIGIAIAIVLGSAVWYDARGRRWTGWTNPGFWALMTILFSIVAIPCYLLARARTTKKQPEPAAPPPSPGWYPDPSGQQDLRYWDGVAWTQRAASEATRPQ